MNEVEKVIFKCPSCLSIQNIKYKIKEYDVDIIDALQNNDLIVIDCNNCGEIFEVEVI